MSQEQEKQKAADAAEQWSQTLAPLAPKEKKERLLWPWVLIIALVVVAVPAAIYVHRTAFEQKPWEIKYPGVTWMRSVENITTNGKPYLGGDVQFDEDVVSAAAFQNFLAELVAGTKKRGYVYWEIFAYDKAGVMKLKGYAADDGRYSITPTEEYTK